jgi:hypothetical protein
MADQVVHYTWGKKMNHLQRIIERVNRNGEFYDENTPTPLLTLKEFFDGNDVVGSIGCNLDGQPVQHHGCCYARSPACQSSRQLRNSTIFAAQKLGFEQSSLKNVG